MGLGVNVRRLREKAGLQQAELANRVGISRAMMCQIERSMKIPSLPVGVAIAKVLGTTGEKVLEE